MGRRTRPKPGRPKELKNWSICPQCGHMNHMDHEDQIGVLCAVCRRRYANPYAPRGHKAHEGWDDAHAEES